MQTVLITGASSGLGKETARKLLAEGFTVYAAARRLERMRELEEMGATVIRMDITRDEDIRAAVELITDERGGIDVLINNAGYGLYGSVEDVPIHDARRQFEVNLFGLARLTQLALPGMRERGKGIIVNISSMGGRIYMPMGAWYHASKHALEGWSDCLRIELAPFGIDVVVIQPGIIETEFGDVAAGPIIEYSGDTTYARLARKMAKATRNAYAPGNGSPPSVVADTVARALKARRPKTRYVVGRMARPLMFMRKWFGDRIFDRALTRQIG